MPLGDRGRIYDYLKALDKVGEQGGEAAAAATCIYCAGCDVEPTIVRLKEQILISRDDVRTDSRRAHGRHPRRGRSVRQRGRRGGRSAIFTSSTVPAERFLSHEGSDCGIANVNITSGAETAAPSAAKRRPAAVARRSGLWKADMRRQTGPSNWSTELPLAQGELRHRPTARRSVHAAVSTGDAGASTSCCAHRYRYVLSRWPREVPQKKAKTR